jgi:hypothetical protein
VNLRDIVDLVLSVNVGGQARSLPPPSCEGEATPAERTQQLRANLGIKA